LSFRISLNWRNKLFCSFWLLCFLACSDSQQYVDSDSGKPNIVILLADDLGWNDVGLHNSEFDTPGITKLMSEGIKLDRFYTYFSCTPTRAGLLTGLYPGRLGLSGKVISPKMSGGLSNEVDNIAKVLRRAGYNERACVGKWHLGHSNKKYHPLHQGFSEFYGHYGGQIDYFEHVRSGEIDWHKNYDTVIEEGYSTDLIADYAVEFIEKSIRDSPFFLYVAFNAPHTPIQAKKEKVLLTEFPIKEDIESKSLRNFTIQERREGYKAMVYSLDDAITQILESIKKGGIEENTIVLFLSDNGGHIPSGASNLPLKGQKGEFYEGGVKVPACILYPPLQRDSTSLNRLTAYVDILPTICGLVNEQPKNEIDGVDLLSNEFANLDELRTFYLGRNALISGDWKLVNEELYNLKNDPYEKKNLRRFNNEKYVELKNLLLEKSKDIEKGSVLKGGYKLKKNWEMP